MTLQEATEAWFKGNYSVSLNILNKLVKLQNTNVIYLCNRALCLLKLELYRKSLKDSLQAIEIDPQYTRAYVIHAYALLKIGNKVEAEKIVQKGLGTTGDLEQLNLLMHYRSSGELQMFANLHDSFKCNSNNYEFESLENLYSIGHKIVEYLMNHNPDLLNLFIKDPANVDHFMKKITLSNSENNFAKNSQSNETKSISKKSAKTSPQNNTVHSFESIEAILSSVPFTIQHGVGNVSIDKIIAYGYWQINTNQLDKGLITFSELIKTNPDLAVGYIGRGTALAFLGNIKSAISEFNKAIEIEPTNVDALKRRGQALTALGEFELSLKDLNYATELSKDFDSYYQRGLVYCKIKDYSKALNDLRQASHLNHNDKNTWEQISMCCLALGRYEEAIENYKKLLSIDSKFERAYSGLALIYKDLNDEKESLKWIDNLISINPNCFEGYRLKNIVYFYMGLHSLAVANGELAFKYDNSSVENNHMLAVGYHDLGLFSKAIRYYDMVLERDDDHFCWCQKEIALFWASHLNVPFKSFNIDDSLNPYLKECWSRKTPRKYVNQKIKPQLKLNSLDVDQDFEGYLVEQKEALEFSLTLGCWVHQNATGFIYNRRQIAMAGMTILEMAQTLRESWFKKEESSSYNKSVSKNCNLHSFGWRDFYNIGVKWRQYSESNDSVWWVDLLTEKQFKEGFGAQTPIMSGQSPVIRYYSVFERAFNITKCLMPEQCSLSEKQMELVKNATSVDELYEIMKKDFFVLTPCHSIRNTKNIMEGTRLTIQKNNGVGCEFSIRTPGTPPRWIDYDSELNYVFEKLKAEATSSSPDLEKISYWILTCTFYWYNFMPLSRGTAMVGYNGMMGMFLACGIHLKSKIPFGVMLDWDAILSETHESFIDLCKNWIYPGRSLIDVQIFDSIENVSNFITTIRELLMSLNYLTKKLEKHDNVTW